MSGLIIYLVAGFVFSTLALVILRNSAYEKYQEAYGKEPSSLLVFVSTTIVGLLWLPLLVKACYDTIKKTDEPKEPVKLLIGLTGLAGSGKSTIAKLLVGNHNFKEISFADPLKRVVADTFNIPLKDCYTEEGKAKKYTISRQSFTNTNNFYKAMKDHCAQDGDLYASEDYLDYEESVTKALFGWGVSEEAVKEYTLREILQLVGTEGIRSVKDSFWVDLAMSKADEYDGHVVFSDVRFDNEALAVIHNFGINALVTRDGLTKMNHASEQGVNSQYINFNINNNGTVDDLSSMIDAWVGALEHAYQS